MKIKVVLKPDRTSEKPVWKELEVEIRGPCDTGGIVTTMAGALLGPINRKLITGGIEIVVEHSVYTKYRDNEGWKYS